MIIILFYIYIKKYFNIFIYGEEDPDEYNDSKMQQTNNSKSNIRVVSSYMSRI